MHFVHASTAIFSFVAGGAGRSNACMACATCAAPMEPEMARTTTPTVRTIDLDRDQLLILDDGRGRLRVLHGAAWLTEEGRAGDAFVEAGAYCSFAGRRTVVGAVAPARLQIVDVAGRHRRPVTAGWQRLVRAVRRQVRRLQFGPLEAPPFA